MKPVIPFPMTLFSNDSGIKRIYKVLNSAKKVYSNEKWNRDIDLVVDSDSWKQAFRTYFRTVSYNVLVWLQYQILTQCLGVFSSNKLAQK